MASVGQRISEAYEWLKGQDINCTLEWNQGNHFRNVEIRTAKAFAWLLAGGLFYTAGAVIYASKPRIFRNPEFGPHEVFHCFVLAGSLCHFILIYRYLVLL